MALPLTGMRVLDLSRVWSGPLACRILADLGAEVIKIEVGGQADRGKAAIPEAVAKMMGVFPSGVPGDQPWNRNGTSIDFNRNKMSVTINLAPEAGRDLFRKLVAAADVVLENYSPRVMRNFGLDYAALRKTNPHLIMISMPGYGMDGPYRDYVAYGTSLEPQAGFSSLMGYPDAGPYKLGVAYPDPVAALHAATAVLIAYWHRLRTGQGQYIDLSQMEAATALIGESIVGYGLTGEVPSSLGNRHPYMAPHGCYPCRGEDRWLVISAGSDDEWRSLCSVIGRPELVEDERFADQLHRWHHQDELDDIISAWTRGLDHRAAMRILQEAGVAAGAVLDAEEMVHDEHLAERGFFWEIPHPAAGTFSYPGLPIHFSSLEVGVRRPAPLLGEHNEHVFIDLLGLSKEALVHLEQEGVIDLNST